MEGIRGVFLLIILILSWCALSESEPVKVEEHQRSVFDEPEWWKSPWVL